VWRLYKTGWIDNWIYWITHSYTQLQCIHCYSSQQLSLFSSSEDFGSNSATTAATNSYGIPCHHYPGNSTELCTILVTLKWGCPRNCPSSLQFTITLAESSLVACLPIPPDPFACNSATHLTRLLGLTLEDRPTDSARTPRLTALSLSLSYVTTDTQSVSLSWCRAPLGAHDQMLITVRQFRY
jgi:hypothetical protein